MQIQKDPFATNPIQSVGNSGMLGKGLPEFATVVLKKTQVAIGGPPERL